MSADQPPVIVRRTRVVPIPIDVVWQLIEPAETLSSWLPLADRSELLSGIGLGRRQRMHSTWRGRAAEIDQEVIGYRENALLRWKHVDERLSGKPARRISKDVTLTVELRDVGAGTEVVLESRNVPSSALAALILRFVAARRIGKSLDRALENLSGAGG